MVCFEFQLTPEEEELRRLRREKNKLAAQKCRSKKKQRADVLEEVSMTHLANHRVKSGKFGHQVKSDSRLQTVEIQMRRLLMSRLIRIITVCLVNLFLFQ